MSEPPRKDIPLHLSRRRTIVAVVVAVLFMAWLIYGGLYLYGTGGSGGVAATGAHVCASTHFDQHTVTCTHDDARIAALESAYLQVFAPSHTFRSHTLTVLILQVNSDGTTSTLGTNTITSVSRADGTLANTLAALFVAASVGPVHGTTYRIEVDDPQGVLGTTKFTYTGA